MGLGVWGFGVKGFVEGVQGLGFRRGLVLKFRGLVKFSVWRVEGFELLS